MTNLAIITYGRMMMRKWILLAIVMLGFTPTTMVTAQEPAKDRKAFIPNRKSVELKGTAIGILLADGQTILSTEGRSGPQDQLVFSADGNSYRWVYVPTQDNPQITNLQVPLANGEKAVYVALNMANPRSVIPWGVKQPYSLVEVEINGGRGTPAIDSFVGTTFKVLDGTKDYPLQTTDVVKQLKQRFTNDVAKMQDAINQEMKKVSEKILNGKPATGPRQKADLMYLTWLNESKTMRVAFKTTITDGLYTFVGGGIPMRDPPPLPPRGKFKKALNVAPALVRVAPPKNQAFRTGTEFGVEFGKAYIVNAKGEVVGTEDLAIEGFTRVLPVPPNIGPGGIRPRPMPIPVAPLPPAKDSE
jgi:hypothetical protein